MKEYFNLLVSHLAEFWAKGRARDGEEFFVSPCTAPFCKLAMKRKKRLILSIGLNSHHTHHIYLKKTTDPRPDSNTYCTLTHTHTTLLSSRSPLLLYFFLFSQEKAKRKKKKGDPDKVSLESQFEMKGQTCLNKLIE